MTNCSPTARRTLLLLALTCILAACAVPASRYLTTEPIAAADTTDPSMAVVLLHPFSETFAADHQLGRHLLTGNRQTKLLIKPGRVARTLDAMLKRQLTSKNIATTMDGGAWDQTPAGLAAFKEPNRLLISGSITRLTINVDETLFSGRAQAEMDVECVLGLIKDKKVIRRRVHVAQEMVTVSFNRQDLENLLSNCLSAASVEILAQSDELVAFFPKETQQPQTTKTDKKQLAPTNERISQTEPRGDSYRTPATITGTFSL